MRKENDELIKRENERIEVSDETEIIAIKKVHYAACPTFNDELWPIPLISVQ